MTSLFALTAVELTCELTREMFLPPSIGVVVACHARDVWDGVKFRKWKSVQCAQVVSFLIKQSMKCKSARDVVDQELVSTE